MATVRFTETHTVTAPNGPTYENGSVHEFRESTCRYFVDKGVAEFFTPEVVNGDAVESAADVAGADSGDPGERAVDVPKRGPGRPRRQPADNSDQ